MCFPNVYNLLLGTVFMVCDKLCQCQMVGFQVPWNYFHPGLKPSGLAHIRSLPLSQLCHSSGKVTLAFTFWTKIATSGISQQTWTGYNKFDYYIASIESMFYYLCSLPHKLWTSLIGPFTSVQAGEDGLQNLTSPL
jgi:hypothetical protein